jgi:hypothetical protein
MNNNLLIYHISLINSWALLVHKLKLKGFSIYKGHHFFLLMGFCDLLVTCTLTNPHGHNASIVHCDLLVTYTLTLRGRMLQ